jgi:hypothetical protein
MKVQFYEFQNILILLIETVGTLLWLIVTESSRGWWYNSNKAEPRRRQDGEI